MMFVVEVIFTLAIGLLGAEPPAVDGPPLKLPTLAKEPTPVIKPTSSGGSPPGGNSAAASGKKRHYLVQIKLIEVDDSGRETLLGAPQLKTAGGNAGLSVDHPDGRRFDFTISLNPGRKEGAEVNPVPGAPRELESLSDRENASITEKLEQRISVRISQQSRREVLKEVAKKASVNIAIDPESAKPVSAQLDAPIDFVADNETATNVLDKLIQPLKLGYAVKHEIVLIANAEKLLPEPEEFSVRTYEVADLVISTDQPVNGKPDFAPLMDRIKETVAPDSWDRKTSPATIRPFNSTVSLVVRQTNPNHAAIERLLSKLRQEKLKVIGEE